MKTSKSNSSVYYRTGKALQKLWLLICLDILVCSIAPSQEISGSYSIDRNPAQVQRMIKLLSSKDQMKDALRCFFGANYVFDHELPDLLVFVDKTKRVDPSGASTDCLVDDGSVNIALLKRGKRRTDLFGEKFVYLVVFVAEREGAEPSAKNKFIKKEETRAVKTTNPDSGKPEIIDEKTENLNEVESFSVLQSSLDYKMGAGEFFLVSMIKAVLRALPGGASVESPTKTEYEELKEIKHEPLDMQLVGTGKDHVSLYFGFTRLALVENTVNRYTVIEKISDERSYYHLATFGNYSPSILGSSIGFTGTLVSAGQRAELADKRFPVNAFLFGHLYIKRPRYPSPHHFHADLFSQIARSCSISLTFGTALKKDLLDDLFVGITFGHVSGSLGILAGCNFRSAVKAIGDRAETKRRAHLCVGINWAL